MKKKDPQERAISRRQMVSRVSARTRLANNIVEDVIDGFLTEIDEAWRRSDLVKLIGFGTFGPRVSKRSKARNPKTGEAVTAKPVKSLHFRPSRNMRLPAEEV